MKSPIWIKILKSIIKEICFLGQEISNIINRRVRKEHGEKNYILCDLWSARQSLDNLIGWKVPIMIIACLSCSQMNAGWSNPSCEASSDKGESRSASEPDSASLRYWEWSPCQRRRNLLPMVKQQANAAIGLSGVVEGGAHRKIDQEPGRPCKVRWGSQHAAGNHNRRGGLARESDKPIVAKKSRNGDGAKGLYYGRAQVERGGEPIV
jgi:hypothetical protein